MDKRRFLLPGKVRLGMGCVMAVGVLLFGGFLAWQAYKAAPELPWIAAVVLGVALLLGLAFLALDLQPNKERDAAEAHREKMLSMPSVTGHIEMINRRWYYHGKRIPEEKARTLRHAYRMDTLVVTFTDPATNEIREIESQEFREDLEAMIAGDLVRVHYSPEDDFWVVPEQYRQHITDEPLAGRSSTDGLRFMAQKHPYLMFAALMGIAPVALVIVLAAAYFL